MAVARIAKELQAQQRPHGTRGWNHLRSREAAAFQDRVQVGRDQVGEEEEQAAEVGVNGTRCQVELADVGHITYDRTGAVGPFFIPTSGQFSEAFLL